MLRCVLFSVQFECSLLAAVFACTHMLQVEWLVECVGVYVCICVCAARVG